eukprot:6190832-Pleurochrysis_carterae.AAC.2
MFTLSTYLCIRPNTKLRAEFRKRVLLVRRTVRLRAYAPRGEVGSAGTRGVRVSECEHRAHEREAEGRVRRLLHPALQLACAPRTIQVRALQACMYVRPSACLRVSMSVCTYVCTCVCAYACAYVREAAHGVVSAFGAARRVARTKDELVGGPPLLGERRGAELQAHAQTHTHAHVHAHMHTHAHAHARACSRASALANAHARTHTHTHLHTNAHTHSHARTHTRAHAHNRRRTRTATDARSHAGTRTSAGALASVAEFLREERERSTDDVANGAERKD